MQKPPIKHNPAFLTDEELAQAFVVRNDDLKLIVRVIRENMTDSNQHVLVIGPRGIGKTMLVQRVALQIRQDEELRHKWYPLIFAEESYEVGTAGEFWLEALFHLGRQTGDPKWLRTYKELKREPVEDRLRERAITQLMDFADCQGNRILLIVENLNMILGDQVSEDDAWKLRHTLMHEPRIMLLGTATTNLDLPENTHKAMFELFKSHVLRPLNDEECQTVWRSVAGQDLGPRRIRAVSILTGGNPRLLAIISHFGAHLSFTELMQEMTALVDEHTDYFKSHLDALPPTERKAYVALADLWDPSTARQVADTSRLGVNLASSLLNRLVSRGAVIEVKGKRRTKHYKVAERMYNIYYLMRRRGAPSERVKAVVEFMVQFYEETELVEVTRRLAEEACILSREDRQYHYYAFEGIVRTATNELRSKIIQRTSQNFLEAPDRPKSLRRLLAESGVPKVCPCDPSEHSDKHIRSLMRIGTNAVRKGRNQHAEKVIREVINLDPTYSDAWIMLGRILRELPDRHDEVEAALRKSVEVGPSNPCAWDHLGRFLATDSNRCIEAEQAFRKALDSYPDCSDAWINLASLAKGQPGKQQDVQHAYREAEKACERQTQDYPDDPRSWGQLAKIRHRYTGRPAEAEAAYNKAIELDPNSKELWERLGSLLRDPLKRYPEAEKAYRKAIEIAPKYISALGNLGSLLLYSLQEYQEAEALFKRIIELDMGSVHIAWTDLGIVYMRLERYAEAEAAFRKAIEIKPDHEWAWDRLASLLHEKLKRYPEAELAYQKVAEFNPRHLCPWIAMVDLLRQRSDEYDNLETAYRKIIELDPRNVWAWTHLGYLITKKGMDLPEAEKAYRNAVEMNPQYAYPRIKLFELLLVDMKQPDRALEVANLSLAVMPEETGLLNSLAWDIFDSGSLEYLHYAEEWARKLVQLDANLAQVHTLACVLARAGKEADALQFTKMLIDDSDFIRANVDDMVRLFEELAAAGCAAEAYTALRESKSAIVLEPVAVALQMYMGTVTQIAPEIAEVAKDVLQRFQRRTNVEKSM